MSGREHLGEQFGLGGRVDTGEAFAVVGVSRNASREEARRAYRERARLLHPDRASEADQQTAADAMAQLNEAWRILSQAYSETATPNAPTVDQPESRPPPPRRPPPPPPSRRAPVPGECGLCGWQPATAVTLRQTTGFIIWWRWRRTSYVACRSCARRLYAETQAKSLVGGWWGLNAPIANIVNLSRNRLELGRHRRRTPELSHRAPEVVAPFNGPAAYRSPWRRPLPLLSTVAAAIILPAIVVGSLDLWVNNVPAPSPLPRPLPIADGVGACVSNTGLITDCTSPTAAWLLIGSANSATDCREHGYTESFKNPVTQVTYCAVPDNH